MGKAAVGDESPQAEQQVVYFEGGRYDVSAFARKHPGGAKAILSRLGKDITDDFYAVGHSASAVKQLHALFCGDAETPSSSAPRAPSSAPASWSSRARLVRSSALNQGGCYELEFELDSDAPVCWPGGHVRVAVAGSKGAMMTRSYTPVAISARRVVLAVKLYEAGEMSGVLREAMTVQGAGGSALLVEVSGPLGALRFGAKTVSAGSRTFSCADRLVLVAGGTGVTPFLSALRAGIWARERVTLIYVVASESELMYRAELERLCELRVVVARRDGMADAVARVLPSPSQGRAVVICGPPGMEAAAAAAVRRAGHASVLATTMLAQEAGKNENENENEIRGLPLADAPAATTKTRRGVFNWVALLVALVGPLGAIVLNGGVPVSWPHAAANGTDAVGLGGRFEIEGFSEWDELKTKTATKYAYRLKEPTLVQYASPWVGYAVHQLLVLWVLARAFREQPKYEMRLRWFNWHMLAVQALGFALKMAQQWLFYNGLSETLPLGFGTGTVFLFLVIVMVMYIPVRGLFFGYGANWAWTQECTDFFRTYHGFVIAVMIVNDFWYHPFESTIGHLCGIFNDMMLLGQMVLIYTPAHLNKYWCLLMETFVLVHAALIALNRGGAGQPGSFGFAYFFILVVTQMHGMGWSKLVRMAIGLVFLTSILIVYGLRLQGADKGFKAMLFEVFLRIPVLEYFSIFFALAYFVLAKKLVKACCVSKAGRSNLVAVVVLLLLGLAFLFMPLLILFGFS
jgi:NAD(P)H-flavin reductase